MALNQPYVFRLYYATEADVSAAQDQLRSLKISSDYVKVTNKDEPGRYKLIFTDTNVGTATKAVNKLVAKPKVADFFDPAADWASGFKPVQSEA